MKKIITKSAALILLFALNLEAKDIKLPNSITIKNIAQNPEGIEYVKYDNTFLLSSLNAKPIVKVSANGEYKAFTHGEKYPLSTAGIQSDCKRNRLLVAGFNGNAIMDNDPKTKGISALRIYNIRTGALLEDINLSSLVPNANAYFANDLTVDKDGNVYITDWYANVIYKVDLDGKASLFWKNNTGKKGTPNGIDIDKDGNLLVSLVSVGKQGHYEGFGLVKIATNNPKNAKLVDIKDTKFAGFDGLVVNKDGDIVGVSNDQKGAGGNMLIKLSTKDGWSSAKVTKSKSIKASTTVAVSKDNKNYVINQDFSDNNKTSWSIKRVEF
jgi:sugar lactone lactonase YvrE